MPGSYRSIKDHYSSTSAEKWSECGVHKAPHGQQICSFACRYYTFPEFRVLCFCNMQPRSKKYGLSCLVCRRRKVRCDGRRPNCANCVRLDERCVYSIQDSSITRLQNALTKSEQRLKTLEQRLRSLLTLEPKRCQDTLRDILASSEDAHPHTPQIPSNNANHSDTTRSDEDAAAQYAYETHEEVRSLLLGPPN